MQQPLVSIIIPCYNAAPYLRATIGSIFQQTYPRLEIILVNDGSTDNTVDVINSFRDSRIRYYYQENKGQCVASNLGWRNSTGAYIKFLDSDDFLNPQHIELQLQALAGREDAVASCEWGVFYDGNPSSASFVPKLAWKNMLPLEWLKTSLQQKGDMMGGWLWMIPRKVMDKIGGWDERLSLNNDFEFSIRLLLSVNEVLFAKGAKIYYRLGKPDSLSQIASLKRVEEAVLSTELGCSHLLRAEDSKEMRLIAANRYQLWIYRIYPRYPEVTTYLKKKIENLGGSDREIEAGRIAMFLGKIIGWKATKRLRIMLQKLGYKKLQFN